MDAGEALVNGTTTPEQDDGDDSDGLPPIVSTVITISFLIAALGGCYAIYRLCCKTRSKHDGSAETGRGRKENFDQFDVNCSQVNIDAEEKKFVNPAAKLTSESESTSSNMSTPKPDMGGLGMLVRSIHGSNASRFSVSRVKERRSSRSSSLKLRVPKQFVNSCGTDGDDQFALALIDRRSNTIHNIDLKDYVAADGQPNIVSTATSAIFAQRWKDKTRHRRSRRSSLDARPRFLPRQASCPSAMSTKDFRSGSLSSHSDESSPQNDVMEDSARGVSLSSIDEATQKLYTSAE